MSPVGSLPGKTNPGGARLRGRYRFFGSRVEFLTDTRRIFDRFDWIYRGFRDESPSIPGEENRKIQLLRAPDHGGFLLDWDDRRTSIYPASAGPDLYMFLLNDLIRNAGENYILHGAALVGPGGGLVLAAASGLGKSTLALELLTRGYRFLSDELAVLDSIGGRLEAFPRALSIGRRAFRNFLAEKKRPAPVQAKGDRSKIMLHPETLFPGQLAFAAPLRQIIFIEPPLQDHLSEDRRLLEFVLYELPPPFLEDLARIPGFAGVETVKSGPYPALRLPCPVHLSAVRIVEDLAARHGAAIRAFYPEARKKWSFKNRPVITSLKSSAGTAALLRYLLNASTFLERPDVPPAGRQRLFIRLARMTAGVRFYRLTPGNLAAMADLVEGTAKEGGPKTQPEKFGKDFFAADPRRQGNGDPPLP